MFADPSYVYAKQCACVHEHVHAPNKCISFSCSQLQFRAHRYEILKFDWSLKRTWKDLVVYNPALAFGPARATLYINAKAWRLRSRHLAQSMAIQNPSGP